MSPAGPVKFCAGNDGSRPEYPADHRRWQGISYLQTAEPDVRPILDVKAVDLATEHVVVVDSRVLGVRVSGRGASRVPRRAPGVGQQIVPDVRREVAEHVEVLLVIEDLVPERTEHGKAQVPRAPAQG